ncbi:HD domain-containing phosphohydrolase [Geomonas edaphica]|uniref:HD domain-containing phosphohydrolase n=1 Tax=Geomonas edaphica TaxID=2570226 RepID=UPI0013A5D22B|nr:HD domain-containing phosphohydrolase [Geomonas edaphica]
MFTPVPTSQERQKTVKNHPMRMLEAENLRLLRELERYRREKRHACEVAVDLLTSIAEARDRETGRHVKRVQDYTLALGNALKHDSPYASLLSRQWIERLARVVPLHDIGKIGIPDRILLKPASLNLEEFEVMKTHTRIGRDIIAAADRDSGEACCNPEESALVFQMAADIALWHHERWDGLGYPDGLAGEAIPLAARIVSVADVFDALTTSRVYKKAFSWKRASAYIVSMSGVRFDPCVVAAFTRLLPQFETIAQGHGSVKLPETSTIGAPRRVTGPSPRNGAGCPHAAGATTTNTTQGMETIDGPLSRTITQLDTEEGTMRALIVDDDELDRKLLERVLKPFCHVDFAATGEEALQKFVTALGEQTPYGLVCLDYNLPGISGARTAQLIRQEEGKTGSFPATTVCALSGAPEAPGEFYIRLGDDPHFFLNQKPYNRTNLMRAVSFGLRRWGVKSDSRDYCVEQAIGQ